jgi:hypothetical protein
VENHDYRLPIPLKDGGGMSVNNGTSGKWYSQKICYKENGFNKILPSTNKYFSPLIRETV